MIDQGRVVRFMWLKFLFCIEKTLKRFFEVSQFLWKTEVLHLSYIPHREIGNVVFPYSIWSLSIKKKFGLLWIQTSRWLTGCYIPLCPQTSFFPVHKWEDELPLCLPESMFLVTISRTS